MSSIYEERLGLLASGYIRQIVETPSPPDPICNILALWLREKVEFIARKYYSTRTTLPLQIHLKPDGFTTKIIDDRHIKRYRINYAPAPRYGKDKDTIKHVFTTIMYPFHCLAFTKMYDIKFDRSGTASINVVALDADDRVIEESERQVIYVNVNSVDHLFDTFDSRAIRKYWKQSIVPKQREDEKVNVNEWVKALREFDILSDEDDCKRIFYFILFQGEADRQEMECDHFEKFVAVTDFDEYNCSIDSCIRRFRKTIPNLIM